MTLYDYFGKQAVARLMTSLWAFAALSGMLLQAQSTTTAPTQAGWLLNKGTLIAPGDLPHDLATSLQLTGARMMGADKAQVTLNGTITDGRGARPAQITIQAPGYMAYREGQSRGVVFDGSGLQSKTGAPTSDDDAILESLLAHFPDSVCVQVAAGGSYRRIGSHFRPDNSKGGNYTGPYW